MRNSYSYFTTIWKYYRVITRPDCKNNRLWFRAIIRSLKYSSIHTNSAVITCISQSLCQDSRTFKNIGYWLDHSACRLALQIVQRNLRRYLALRTWNWWKMWSKVKPLLNVANVEEEMRVHYSFQNEIEINKLKYLSLSNHCWVKIEPQQEIK